MGMTVEQFLDSGRTSGALTPPERASECGRRNDRRRLTDILDDIYLAAARQERERAKYDAENEGERFDGGPL